MRHATPKQIAVVEKIIEMKESGVGKISISKAMRESNNPYTVWSAKNPQKLTRSPGFKQAYRKYGLSEGLIIKALAFDIENKPKNRIQELRLGAELLKLTEPEDRGDTFNTIIFADERINRIARRIVSSSPKSETISG